MSSSVNGEKVAEVYRLGGRGERRYRIKVFNPDDVIGVQALIKHPEDVTYMEDKE